MVLGYARMLLLISYLLLHTVPLTVSQPNFRYSYCETNGNYTINSTYDKNLDAALSSLSSNTTSSGFYTASLGRQDSDRVNAFALCRGDVAPDICHSCVNNSISKMKQQCPYQKGAFGGYDECLLRYANSSIFYTTSPRSCLWNSNNVSDVNGFNEALRPLLNTLRGRAIGGSSLGKFATGNTSGPSSLTIYELMQCTPDLSREQCNNCLDGAIAAIPGCSNGRQGGRIVRPSCNLRYEVERFYNVTVADAPSPMSPAPSSPTPPGKGSSDNVTRTVIIIVVSTVAFVILIFVCISKRKRKQRKRKRKQRKPNGTIEVDAMEEFSSAESLQYDFDTIEVATDYFSDTNKLGQGGFGAVYKGRLQSGQEIAVKRLSRGSDQGEQEFKNEVVLVAQLQHRNLARLLGFCLEGTERLLIYEFVANASLDHFIFDPMKRSHLDWDKRYKIIGGLARGILYLHEDSRLRVIHRDLKASNVLLDAEMNPKISDFGMARLFNLDETHGSTNRIVGTYGYMSPEYAMYGQFSIKSDVYSFGILVLEIISGQKNYSFRNGDNVEDLASYAWKNWREGTPLNVVDPTLTTGSGSIHEMMRCIHIALLCVQENVADRPTMASVVLMLNSFSLTLAKPSEPAFFIHSSTSSAVAPLLRKNNSEGSKSSKANEKSVELSLNEASITELYPR